jgi:hypothetical protein
VFLRWKTSLTKKSSVSFKQRDEKKAADSSGFEDNFSKGRADEKRRGKEARSNQLSFRASGWVLELAA